VKGEDIKKTKVDFGLYFSRRGGPFQEIKGKKRNLIVSSDNGKGGGATPLTYLEGREKSWKGEKDKCSE